MKNEVLKKLMKTVYSVFAESESELSYRRAIDVTEFQLFSDGYAYPVCPRCSMTLERTYMNYCDRCGQRLKWKGRQSIKLLPAQTK